MVNKQRQTMPRSTAAGFSLLLAMLVASVALSIGIALLGLTVKQLDLSVTARDSEIAFHAASAGIECLQWFRYDESDQLLNNDSSVDHNIDKTCMGETAEFQERTSPAPPQNRREYYDVQVEGNIDGTLFCTEMEMVVVTVDATDRNRGFDTVGDCPDGDACTVAKARGYNVPCDLVGTQFSVQRELTAEF